MELYNILTGNLYSYLDTPYDKENNKIDVYCSAHWTADNEEEYQTKEDLIHAYENETELFSMSCWCDISGYDYWVIQQGEENYVSIDVCLKKQPKEYSQEEMQLIRDAIVEADYYFENNL